MRSSLKSSLQVSLISLILIFSLTPVSLAHPHYTYSHEERAMTANPNWMSVLPDSVRLSELSIPGTHESLSFYGPAPIINLVRTQRMSLVSQLESGIRVFDIRCAVVDVRSGPGLPGYFNIYHGDIFQKEHFGGVLDTVVKFLRNHKRETVLMRVKEEKTDRPGDFETIFRDTYWNKAPYKDFMWKGTDQNPTLAEMRGKIVILQDFARWQCPNAQCPSEPISSIHPQYGICYNSFVDQDKFQVLGREALYDKWEWVKKYLDHANFGFDEGRHRDTKFINYLSGVGTTQTLGEPNPWFVVSGHQGPGTGAERLRTKYWGLPNQWPDFPRDTVGGREWIYYEGTNTLVYDYIRNGHAAERVGIIMTDFPGKGLIERIICINYPKTDPLCQRLPK